VCSSDLQNSQQPKIVEPSSIEENNSSISVRTEKEIVLSVEKKLVKDQFKGLKLMTLGEVRRMSLGELDLLFSELHLDLLMKIITKNTKVFDSKDIMD